MIDVLQFVFSSFWTWLGTLLLITAIASAMWASAATIRSIFSR